MADTPVKAINEMSYSELEAYFCVNPTIDTSSVDFLALLGVAASSHADKMRVQYSLNFSTLFPLLENKLTALIASSSLTSDQQASVIAQTVSGAIQQCIDASHKQYSDETYLAAQVALILRQVSALDDAVRRDVAKIICECLGIIKSGGNSAGSWWAAASKAVNILANDDTLANKIAD